MTYTKKQFGSELKSKIEENNDSNEISKWAFNVYTNYGLEFENGLDYFVLKLISMEEGPEFFLSKEELSSLADELIVEISEQCYPCPCCDFLTRSEPEYGTFEICPVCNWEDDDVQYNDPDYKGGANAESLNEAKENYKKFGASAKKYIKEVRAPLPDEIP